MVRSAFTTNELSAGEPWDENLTVNKLKANDDDHETRILALEAGGGASGGTTDASAFSSVLSDPFNLDNAPIFWHRRFNVFQHTLRNGANKEGADFENKHKNDLITFLVNRPDLQSIGTAADSYLAIAPKLEKIEKMGFILKKGCNFFGLGYQATSSNTSDSVTITINGNSVTTEGLVDETGAARADTFSSVVGGTSQFQGHQWFFGLDANQEHTIIIENTDSGTDGYWAEDVVVGYKSPNPTIDRNLHINEGKALVKGSTVNFAEGDFEFTDVEGYGKTSAIAVNANGTLAKVEGTEGYMSQVKAQEAIAFSGAVTTLPMKSTLLAPDAGIGLLSTDFGEHHLFSWTSKTETTIQTHSLDGIIWASQPQSDITPLDNIDSSDSQGEININLWAIPPSALVISNSNNKIDFKVKQNGVLSGEFTATIANGAYSSDLVPLGPAIVKALTAAKSLNIGEYICDYDETSQLWRLGINGLPEVDEIQFLASSGSNVANSVFSSIGVGATDQTGATSYLAGTAVPSKAYRIHKAGEFMNPNDSRILHSSADVSVSKMSDDIMERVGLGYVRSMAVSTGIVTTISVDPDCCGLSVHYVATWQGCMIRFYIDDCGPYFLLNTDATYQDSAGTGYNRGTLISAYITFPRGSKKITLMPHTYNEFSYANDTQYVEFAGVRQYHSRSNIESLATNQAILKSYDIAPLRQYAHIFTCTSAGALYTPGGDEPINTIAENGGGSWAQEIDAGPLAGANYARRTGTSGDYLEINFTLQGKGSIRLHGLMTSVTTNEIKLFLSASSIVEGTDLFCMNNTKHATTTKNWCLLESPILPAGTYNARFKTEDTGEFAQNFFVITDEEHGKENCYDVGDMTNNYQGISYPINVQRHVVARDSGDRVLQLLERSGFKEGRCANAWYAGTGMTWSDGDEATSLMTEHLKYYGTASNFTNQNEFFNTFNFCKSVTALTAAYSSHSATNTAFIDERSTPATFDVGISVKGGSAPSSGVFPYTRVIQKTFELSCSHSASNTYTIADTRGIQNNRKVILYDGTDYETFTISSFVADTSFTTTQTPSVITAADVEKIIFFGFHSFKIRNDTTSDFYISAFEVEPLDISQSKERQRNLQNKKTEVQKVYFQEMTNGTAAYYPYFSDGVQANYSNSIVSVTQTSSTGMRWILQEDLKNINLTGGTNLDLQIMSVKEVLEPINDWEVF